MLNLEGFGFMSPSFLFCSFSLSIYLFWGCSSCCNLLCLKKNKNICTQSIITKHIHIHDARHIIHYSIQDSSYNYRGHHCILWRLLAPLRLDTMIHNMLTKVCFDFIFFVFWEFDWATWMIKIEKEEKNLDA